MSIKTFIAKVLAGPTDSLKPSYTVQFYMLGGQVITTAHVREFKISKTPAGGVHSYSLIWHDGYAPAIFSLTLDHISAITVVKA